MKEDYVSFEIAKLLKEKGFDGDVDWYYPIEGGEITQLLLEEKEYWTETHIQASSLAMVMKWLRERYKLNIIISVDDLDWFYSIIDYTHKGDVKLLKDLAGFNSYESACEAACIYVLKNLI